MILPSRLSTQPSAVREENRGRSQGPKAAAFFLTLTSSVDALQACHWHEQLVPWPLIWPILQEVLLVCPIAGTAASRPRESIRSPFSSWPFDKKV
jgi:hypothetical protein